MTFRGLFPAMLTPFTKDEILDKEGLRTNVDFLIDNGVHGLVPVATSGEYPHLSETEWKELFDDQEENLGEENLAKEGVPEDTE